jgi:ubiquitin-protein ligase E3 A
VRLYIDYEFQLQCQQQLSSFKKGFNRIVDI